MPDIDQQTEKKISNSLFDDTKSDLTFAKHQELLKTEKERRSKIFLRYILPAFFVLLALIAYLLKPAMKAMFGKIDHEIMDFPEGDFEESEFPEELNIKKLGNEGAKLSITLKFKESSFLLQQLREVLFEVSELKPSEIFIVIEETAEFPGSDSKTFQLLFNDSAQVNISSDSGKSKLLDFTQEFTITDFIAALESEHKNIYASSLSPLKLDIDLQELDKKIKSINNPVPAVISEKSEFKLQSSEGTIVLPDFKLENFESK